MHRSLRHRPPRALLAWLGAAAVAVLTAQVVASDLAALHRRAQASGAEVRVVVAAHDLPLGSTIEAGDLRLVTRYETHLPPMALRALGDAEGRVVAVPVLEGAEVSDRHLAPRERTGLDGAVPPGMRAIRVVVDEGVRPEPGSVVDVLVTFDPGIVGDAEPTRPVVRGALVVAVDGEPGSPGVAGGLPGERLGVTLLVDDAGAHRLAFAAANGIVTLTLAPPEEACCPLLP